MLRAWLVIAGTLALAVSAAAEPARLPVPNDVIELPDTYRVDVADTALGVEGYVTAMPVEELLAFYGKALSSNGWRMEPLPWQTQHAQAMDHIDEAMKKDPAVAQDAAMQARQAQLQRTQRSLERRLHAVHGQDHVVVQLLPYPGEQTAVFLNRWSGQAGWERTASSPAGADQSCCSGAPLANPGVLPMSLPQYPGSAVIAKSAGTTGDNATVALTTPDGADAVEAFYKKQMAYNGWQLEQASTQGEGLRFLSFHNNSRLCGIVLGPGGAPGAQTLITMEVMPRPPFEQGQGS